MASTRVTQLVRAPRAVVYAALVDAAAVQRWMVPDGMSSEVHAFDAREGGELHITLTYEEDGPAGKTGERTDSFHGRFTRLVPEVEVVQAVAFDTADPDVAGEMTITYRLADAVDGGGTEVTGIHDDLPPGVSPADNELGWRMSLGKLAALVEGRPSVSGAS